MARKPTIVSTGWVAHILIFDMKCSWSGPFRHTKEEAETDAIILLDRVKEQDAISDAKLQATYPGEKLFGLQMNYRHASVLIANDPMLDDDTYDSFDPATF